MVESVDAYAARHGLVGRSDERALLRTNHCRCDPGIIRLGDINADTFVINSCDGTRRQIGEVPAPFKTNATVSKPSAADAAVEPAAAGISIRLQERIRDLEQTLREERRALAEAEQRYEKLEEKYNALLRRSGPTA